jgi:hypothetical protein
MNKLVSTYLNYIRFVVCQTLLEAAWGSPHMQAGSKKHAFWGRRIFSLFLRGGLWEARAEQIRAGRRSSALDSCANPFIISEQKIVLAFWVWHDAVCARPSRITLLLIGASELSFRPQHSYNSNVQKPHCCLRSWKYFLYDIKNTNSFTQRAYAYTLSVVYRTYLVAYHNSWYLYSTWYCVSLAHLTHYRYVSLEWTRKNRLAQLS